MVCVQSNTGKRKNESPAGKAAKSVRTTVILPHAGQHHSERVGSAIRTSVRAKDVDRVPQCFDRAAQWTPMQRVKKHCLRSLGSVAVVLGGFEGRRQLEKRRTIQLSAAVGIINQQPHVQAHHIVSIAGERRMGRGSLDQVDADLESDP